MRAFEGALDPGTADETARVWFAAYRASASGAFDDAERLARALIEHPDWTFPARMTLSSVLRQTGRHSDAEVTDQAALDGAATDAERAESLTSLAADAVGLADPKACADRLARAGRLVSPDDRRGLIRLSWVRAEHALLTDDAAQAVAHSRLALADARALGWPRHVAKSLLFLGAALEAARSAEARLRLTEAERTARAAGATPIADAAAGLLARAR